MQKIKLIVAGLFTGLTLCSSSWAIPQIQLPGSTEPGVVSKMLSAPAPTAPRAQAVTPTAPKQASALGPQAEKIKFSLKQIILEGNHAYSEQQLKLLYQKKLNTKISVAELQDIVQSITNYYRNNGYILTRAILPPQHVHAGIVHVRVIEGYIEKINIIGTPKGAKKILATYGQKIVQSRPLQINVMQHYLRLANEVPGLQARAVLEPSKTAVGASDLNLSALERTLTGYASYDNYGTLYMGPQQVTANAALNSIIRSGDSARVTYESPARHKELKFYDISYQTLVGSNGMNLTVGRNNSKTQPGFTLALLNVHGDATTYYGLISYPLLRTQDKNLSIDGGVNYVDSWVTSIGGLLYSDHLRTVKAGGSYSFADRFNGSNLLDIHGEQGLSNFGATQDTHSTTTSRFGGRANFTKFNLQASRWQLLHGRFSAYAMLSGQYAFSPLLSSSQFSFGGSQMGRGFDSAEIIGDRGMAGSLELRADLAPAKLFLQTVQPYVYYDAGVVWNRKHVANTAYKQSAASTGFGSRFVFSTHFSGNLMFTQPLTKGVAAESVRGGRGRAPRVFFSIVGTL